MTCHCSSDAEHAERERRTIAGQDTSRKVIAQDRIKELEATVEAMSVKSDNYEVTRMERVGDHLVLQVKYPNCTKCQFEGEKIMVFLYAEELAVMRWRRIDPHFRKQGKKGNLNHAPSPHARFPGSADGWKDAKAYAKSKIHTKSAR